MLLTPEVLAILILDAVFLVFGSIAFYLSIKIYKGWDLSQTTKEQYNLEKQSYLAGTIVKYIFTIKIPLFLFFIFLLDKISNVITGAMCAVGVVDATVYGTYLFALKILNLYLFGFWLVLNNFDVKRENLPYTKIKFGLFTVLFLLFLFEIILEITMFNSISIDKMVSCCGAIFSSSEESAISALFLIPNSLLLSLFYGNFILLVLGYFLQKNYLYMVFNLLFIPISIITLIMFFGTYIYELPTHHCPFCFLQKDYYYIGYLIYTTLFLGTFFGILAGVTKLKSHYKTSLLFITLYTAIVSFYPIFYFIKNGVWL